MRLPSPSRKVERPGEGSSGQRRGSAKDAGRGVPIRVARPAALRDPLGIGRGAAAIDDPRALSRETRSSTRKPQVRIAADVDLWLPVLKPGAARAFDLALVIDTSPSMAAWLDVLREPAHGARTARRLP